MCDITSEFQKFVHISNGTGSKSASVRPRENSRSTLTAFNEATAEIAKGVHRTSQMLSKLTKLVRNQGLFDDSSDEIKSLIFRIKQDLNDLNTKCDTTQMYVDSKKSTFGSPSQSSSHNSMIVDNLKQDLLHTTSDFKTVLELRSTRMKDQQARRINLTGNGVLSPLRQMDAHNKNRALIESSMRSIYQNSDSNDNENGMNSNFHSNANSEQTQLLLAPLATTQYYESREIAVNEVEKTIGELGQLFHRLSTMVSHQQQLVERIDEDVEMAVTNTEKAQKALMKAYEKISSNRGMMMKIGAIVLVFVIFFVLFLM